MNTVFHCRNVNFSYDLGETKTKALVDVNLDIKQGEFICLWGPSGSGKSTLLNLLGLIEPVTDGEITFNNEPYSRLPESRRNQLRRHDFGYIFQDFYLMEVLGADENIEFFLTRAGVDKQERRTRVKESLDQVHMYDLRKKRPNQMSGGQRQRIAVARALAKKPKVILADEPTANLDQKNSREVMEILRSLTDQGYTIIMSSHDKLALEYATRQIKLEDGRIVN